MKWKRKLYIVIGIGFLIYLVLGITLLYPYYKSSKKISPSSVSGIIAYVGEEHPTIIGYEYLSSDILNFWNLQDDYYLNISSGIQWSNHHNEWWTHNIFCAGYCQSDCNSLDNWNYKCMDDLPIQMNPITDNETYVSITGSRNITILGRTVNLNLTYYLGVDDGELSITPKMRNVGDQNIPIDLGFAWRVNEIKIANDYENDKIFINDTTYNLHDNLDLVFRNMTRNTTIYVPYGEGNISHYEDVPIPFYRLDDGGFILLRWNPNLNYFVQVQNKTGQYNAPVTLVLRTVGLDIGQSKQTEFFWRDPDTGWKNPSATGEDYSQWYGTPSNAYTSDDSHAEGNEGNAQDYYNFSFGVPIDATIDGIEVSIEARRAGFGSSPLYLDVELSSDSGDSYTTTSQRNTWTEESDTIRTYGNSTYLWGRTWNYTDFSNATFRLWCENDVTSSDTHQVDHIKVKVYYTEGADNPPQYSDNSTNSTIAGQVVEHRLNWTDDTGLSGYIFSYCNGTYGTAGGETLTYYNFTDLIDNVAFNGTGANADMLGGTEVTSQSYTDLNSDNEAYADATSGANQHEPFLRFNFTIDNTVVDINWINVSLNGFEDASPETATAYIFNRTSGAFDVTIGTVPTSDGTIGTNITGAFSNLINANSQFTIGVQGSNFDSGEAIHIDFVEVTVSASSGGIGVCYEADPTFTNESFTSMTGTNNWSNVTIITNSTVGSTIKWRVYANDSTNQWNASTIYSYNTTSAVVDCWTYDSGTGEYYVPAGCECYCDGAEAVLNLSNCACA